VTILRTYRSISISSINRIKVCIFQTSSRAIYWKAFRHSVIPCFGSICRKKVWKILNLTRTASTENLEKFVIFFSAVCSLRQPLKSIYAQQAFDFIYWSDKNAVKTNKHTSTWRRYQSKEKVRKTLRCSNVCRSRSLHFFLFERKQNRKNKKNQTWCYN